jgi:hypothetical protein
MLGALVSKSTQPQLSGRCKAQFINRLAKGIKQLFTVSVEYPDMRHTGFNPLFSSLFWRFRTRSNIPEGHLERLKRPEAC